MERRDGLSNIDLDVVANVIAARRIELEASGLAVAQPTWMIWTHPGRHRS